MTIAQELTALNATKTAIAAAIEGKGGDVTGAPFSEYAAAIDLLSTGGGGSTGPALEWSEAYYQSVLNSIEPYQRPKDWLTLPDMIDGDSKLIGLYAVYPNGNYVALSAAGSYTVNWGDGTVENFASNIQAEHIYNYAAPALDGTNAPVSLAMDGTVTRANHGRVEGEKIKLYTIAGVTELKEGQDCYVRDVTLNSFKLSTTVGGVALTFASAGTAALLPYKQAIIQLTPQAGQTLISLTLQKKHTALSSNTNAISINFLDLKLGGPSITSLMIGSNGGSSSVVSFFLLEQVAIYRTALTSLSYLFYSLRALKNVSYFNTTAVTNMSYMFQNCYALQTVPLFNTTAVTIMNSMFQYCYTLQTVPLFNTAKVTDMSGMFYNCYALSSIKMINIKESFSILDCSLDAAALNELYTNLSTVTGKRITVTGNPGVTGDNPAIATAKGWTVTG